MLEAGCLHFCDSLLFSCGGAFSKYAIMILMLDYTDTKNAQGAAERVSKSEQYSLYIATWNQFFACRIVVLEFIGTDHT